MASTDTIELNEELPGLSSPQRWRALTLLAIAELLAMSLWFSASAITPALRLEWGLSDAHVSWLIIAVQLGFVSGTLLSAFFNLPDIIGPRYLLAASAFVGAAANATFGFYATGAGLAITLRFLTGLCLAGVYPPGMKIISTWFRRSRGLALGVLVGALTLGKASPYLVNGFGSANWRINMVFVSLLAAVGGLLVLLFVADGPFAMPAARFDWKQVFHVFRNRGVRLANFGYFGHMWELYAMWTWVPVMIRASLEAQGSSPFFGEVASFLVIGCGAAGCVLAGLVADRIGRTVVTSWAMAISGSCCLLIGFLFGASPVLLLFVAAIWGATVVADSAQFSTCVTELGNPRYIGTAQQFKPASDFF